MTSIVDNRSRCVADFLAEKIEIDSELSIVSAYFTIYAYGALRNDLDNVKRVRFLYGDPKGIGYMDPSNSPPKSFNLTDSTDLEIHRVLEQKSLTRPCVNWIQNKVEVRTIEKTGFLHGKFYFVEHENNTAALVGSSNFTQRGLGLGIASNIELNLKVNDKLDRAELIQWFNSLWNDENITSDVKQEVIIALKRLGANFSPDFIYYKSLFHIFEKWITKRQEQDDSFLDIHLYDTPIWQHLFQFQKEGAIGAINRLLKFNGCTIADSVGLGKTLTALAVIRYFEMRNERVLVLCPKKIEQNWVRFTAWAGYANNIFEKDRFGYSVRAHTDLSRYEGREGSVDLAQFNWGTYDLIVIDESHNFRNEGRDQYDEAGNVIKRSRYNRLLEEVIKSGTKTKVLMLSATPVNTNLRDLRNQIYLITEKRQDAFRKELGISSIQTTFAIAQRSFLEWNKDRLDNKTIDKEILLEKLGPDFLTLLDNLSIARSRVHIKRHYPEETVEKIGGFPKRAAPDNLYPSSDSKGELLYDDIHEKIGNFRLAVYLPALYVIDTSSLEQEREQSKFDQREREISLVGMMRTNLLKRLESSVHAFGLTLRRILDRMEDVDSRIDKWLTKGGQEQLDFRPEEDEEDEEFAIGRGRQYSFDELNVEQWQRDLQEDMKSLRKLHKLALRVDETRDLKLAELKHLLKKKTESPTIDLDGKKNRKTLVFTTFSDTAVYLYEQLFDWAVNDLQVHIALVTGQKNQSSLGESEFSRILSLFAPMAQELKEIPDLQIDILIATDCLSEGQNLQDCDSVVNYDIHWNPIRIMQRFGRIDRLKSRNKRVYMTNFWPTENLDQYLDLKNRVEARMALVDVSATGFDDPLNANPSAPQESNELIQSELKFRDKQLIRLRDEILDLEDAEDGISLSDLTLDDYLADLLHDIQNNRKLLEDAPFGIYAVVKSIQERSEDSSELAKPGVIFCLKQNGDDDARTPNRIWPYFLVYVRSDGSVRYSFRNSQQCLSLFRKLAVGKSVSAELENIFDKETNHGQDMEKYSKLLKSAMRNIKETLGRAELNDLFTNPDTQLTEKSNDFTLITWLLILE